MFSKKTSVEGVWERNTGVCSTCVRPFTLLRRAHHCRRCGRVFCNTCSQHRLLLPTSRSGRSKRVCTQCFNAGSGAPAERFSFSGLPGGAAESRGTFSGGSSSGTSSGGGASGSRHSRGVSLDDGAASERRMSAFASFSQAAPAHQAAAVPPHLRGFPKEGVTLEGVRAWMTSRGGIDAFREQTVADAVTRHVLPSCTPGKPLCAALPLFHTGPATVHVCHAWGGKFLRLVAALEAWEAAMLARGALPSPPVFWLDCFSLPLHSPPTHSWESLVSTYATGVAAIGKTVLVLDPEAPTPLRRTWCLFELGAALQEAPFDLALAPLDEARLHKQLGAPGGLEAAAARLLAPIDVAASEAGRSEDKRRLLRAFKEGAFDAEATAGAVRRALGAWLIRASQRHLDAATSAIARTPMLAALARLQLRVLGDHKGAEEQLRAVLEVMEPILGDAHPRAIAVRMDLGAACAAQGKVGEAEGFYRAALAGAAQGAALGKLSSGSGSGSGSSGSGSSGSGAPGVEGGGGGSGEGGGGESEAAAAEADRAAAQCCLAACLVQQGKLGEAELLYRQAINYRRGVIRIGAGHRDTLEAVLRLGQCLARAGGSRAQEAEVVLGEAVEGTRRHLTQSAPLCWEAEDALGQLYRGKEGGEEASEAFLASALLLRRRAIGDAHPATLQLLVALGAARHRLGDAAGAAACFEEALAAQDDAAKASLIAFCAELSAGGNLEDSEMFLSLIEE